MTTDTGSSALLYERIRAELLPELELIRSLGTGATANVYLAREVALQRLVAVKVLRPEVAADAVLRQRFEREAQSAARITHPHVTVVHRVGRLRDDTPYIVMEYVEGRTLADIIAAGLDTDISQSRAILADLASALAAAHDRGIVHRDVRPGNVLVDRNGRAVLGDFGIAALLESGAGVSTRLTAAGVRLGDTRYLSPEQIRGEHVVEQSDVYSFGILACELLTGSHPYAAKGDAQLLAAHLQQEPRRLRDLRPDIDAGPAPSPDSARRAVQHPCRCPDIDAGVAQLVEHCLAKEPGRRPLASELAARLSAAGSAVVEEPERSTLEQFVHELRRRKVYQVVAGYGALALAVLALAQAANDAAILSDSGYRRIVACMLAGFPLALVLSWLYDIRPGAIERTEAEHATTRVRSLVWIALATIVGSALLLAWLMLQGGR